MTYPRFGHAIVESLEDRRLLSVGDAYAPPADPRAVTSLNAGWKFKFAPSGSAASSSYDDSGWSAVSVPHTWNALDAQDGTVGYARGQGWYRRTIAKPAAADAGDRLYLKFDGASVVANVYLDGVAVGTHAGAFAAFDVDVTAALADGRPHVLAVRCDNSAALSKTVAPSSGADLNIDGGLYRGVSLIDVDAAHVTLDDDASAGVFFSTPSVGTSSAAVTVKTDLAAGPAGDVVVHGVLADAAGRVAAEASTTRTLDADDDVSVTQNGTVLSPHLWNGTADPYLYDLYVELRTPGGRLLDLVHQKVGLRSYSFDAAGGFRLNGHAYDLHGAMVQPDALNKGWAVSDADVRADFGTLQDLGATVVRSHVQLPALFYDLADAAGVVVMSEVPVNGSRDRGQTFSYDAFLSNAKQQLRELIRQNGNRPSVLTWGLYNELADSATNDSLIAALKQYAHSLDSSRPTVGASWNDRVGTLEKSADLTAFNAYYGWYHDDPADLGPVLDAAHAASPSTPIAVSEYGAGGSITQHGRLDDASAYGTWQPEEFQNQVNEQTWPLLAARPYLWAKIQFQLFDNSNDKYQYAPNPGYNNKGLVTRDHATRKDSFYYYKAQWSSDTVLYLTSRRWTTRTDATTEIKAYANTEAPKLYINGTLVGTMTAAGAGVWRVPAVTLARGSNVVTVLGRRNGHWTRDTATWTYTGTGGNPPVTAPPAVPTPPDDGVPRSGSLRGFTFDDADKDGIYDASESRSGNKIIFIDADNDGVLDSTEKRVTTAADGTWAFTGLAAGTYRVRRVFPSGYVQSTAPVNVTLAAGQNVTGLAIGSKSAATPPPPPTGTAAISGLAFDDLDKDGYYDHDDLRAAGQTIFMDADDDGVKDSGEVSTVTDSEGRYAFTGLAPHAYRVCWLLPRGRVESTPRRDWNLAAGDNVTAVWIGAKTV